MLPISHSTINSTTITDLTATKVKSKKKDTLSTINNSINMSSENINSHTNPYLTNSLPQDSPPKDEGFGLAGLILSLVGLPVVFFNDALGIFLGLIAILFCTISLVRIKRNPAKYKGKGVAIWGLLLGIIGLVLGLIVSIANIGD